MTYRCVPYDYEEFGDLYTVLFENENLDKTNKKLSDFSLKLLLGEFDDKQIKKLLEMMIEIYKMQIMLKIKKNNGGKWIIKDTPITRDILKGYGDLK